MNPEVSIIIINFNTPDLVYDCIRSIISNCKINYEIIVVDNSSKTELKISEKILDSYSNLNYHLISMENRGFGSANNLGAKHASGKYLWLLNSDTILFEDTLLKLVSFYKKHTEIGAISPVLKHNDGSIQSNFFANFQTLGSITFRRYSSKKIIDYSQEFFYTDVVVGAALMIRKDIFDKIGGFDENIFMYLEDDDLCKRVIDLGYRNAVCTKTSLIHLEGKSTKRNKDRKKLYYASQTYFWRKHNGFWPTLIMRILRWPLKTYKTR